MREGEGEKRALYPPPVPRRPERSEERRWPSPTPLPLVPPEDVGKVLKQILDRLDAIEKRLERIEKLLAERALPIKDAELARNNVALKFTPIPKPEQKILTISHKSQKKQR